jgi:hypothetical protein
MTRRYAPRDLEPAGRRLWRSVVEKYPELTIGEELLLVEAARTADLCDRLNTAAALPQRPRGTLVELRAQRLTLAKLVAALGI